MSALRYVILRHEGIPDPHFDLMFETTPGSALTTWRAPNWPPDPPYHIERIHDHRREYLGYEGAVSSDRGWVSRVETGTYEPLDFGQPLLAFKLHAHRGRILFLCPVSESLWLPWLDEGVD